MIAIQNFQSLLTQLLELLHRTVAASVTQQEQQIKEMEGVDSARFISKITVNFFKFLDMHVANLSQIVEEGHTVNNHKLAEFDKKFEECAAKEERELLEKVAELLESSNKNLVQSAIFDLRESASGRTSKLQQEMSTMQVSTASVKAEWTVHMGRTESQYIKDTSAVEIGKNDLEEVLENCLKMAKLGTEQWKNAQESMIGLEKCNVASVDSMVRKGLQANQNLRSQFCSALSAAFEDVDVANKDLISSIDT
ncbi:hypothetical protein SAY87_019543 [Trapa incisa]|uniref:Uncharacterized protein n=1 Tax=Trapa incisa TaxID=236973 RepID=A0AAN7K5G5_9MYRT|nr:hypothetical protein SAY87_019543 [Trapa incisa]